MPKILPSGAEHKIRTLSSIGLSSRKIVEALKNEKIDVSQKTVINIVNNTGITREAMAKGEIKPKVRRPPIVRTPENIKKVHEMATKRNPLSQRNMAQHIGTSQRTISKMIHVDNQLVTRRKKKVHKLKENHKNVRKTNSRKLYEQHLAGNKCDYVVSIDEAYIYVTYCNGERKICYIKRSENLPEDWVNECNESFPEGFMVVGGMSGRGPLPLIRIPKNTKISSDTYIEYVLKPLFEIHIPKLYPNEMNKIFFHHDMASSHTSAKTQQFLQEMAIKYGINYIKNKDIPVKSPDASPMDFFGFGLIKQKLFNRRAKTLNGVWKCANEEWNKVTPEMARKVFDNWKWRLRLINKKNGAHIEQTKDIHRRRIK
jgi:hypothetical protein